MLVGKHRFALTDDIKNICPRRIRRRQDSKGDDDPEGGESENNPFFDSFLCSLGEEAGPGHPLYLSMESHQGLKTLNTKAIQFRKVAPTARQNIPNATMLRYPID
ncbi:hypothetical protein CDAR_496821 [Caerostris darwini]|uniref:Uncharacterized protein n=1 Tax=Caerostris darwini TaxID=1538125 RepID=A0AAV4U594_9ARAC|nr:hypothetical protein CDAR_496821 [Caerostris darwini]